MLYENVLRARFLMFGASGCGNRGRAPLYKTRFASFTCEIRGALVVGISSCWEGPTSILLNLAFSRKGPLKCLLGGPRSWGVRFLGRSYRRRRPQPLILRDFLDFLWFEVVLGWARLGPGMGPDGFRAGPEGGSKMVLGSRTGARTTRFRPWAHKFTLWGI